MARTELTNLSEVWEPVWERTLQPHSGLHCDSRQANLDFSPMRNPKPEPPGYPALNS